MMRVSQELTGNEATFAYWMLLVYTVSFLLHVPERLPVLGVIRLDLILLILLTIALIKSDWVRVSSTKPGRMLILLCIWIVVTVPFVEWPGSVIRVSWKPFLKAIIFFFAIVLTIDNRKRLKVFLTVFLGCQLIRVFEPLYMHVTDGYWGSAAHVGGGEFMNRLSGAPSDVVNPNGLAFVIVILLPFLHVLLFRSGIRRLQVLYLAVLPLLVYALMLTGSRSGLVGVFLVLLGLGWLSRRRIGMAIFIVILSVGFVTQLDDMQRDRFVSIFSDSAQNAATAQGRIRGWSSELSVALENPIFGHGIATSKEALFNRSGSAQVSHNMYTEALIELGVPGAAVFLAFIFSSGRLALDQYKSGSGRDEIDAPTAGLFTNRVSVVLLVCWFAWLVFHLAQYGLTEYHWYVLAGLTVAVQHLLLPHDRRPADEISSGEVR